MTLIEVLIVMAIVALISGGVLVGVGQTSSARLRHSGTMIAGAVRVAFARASATSKTVRLVMDFDEDAIWLEEGDQPHLVQSKDITGTGGAEAATEAEKLAREESSRIVKGPVPPRARFKLIDVAGVAESNPNKGKKPLDGVRFREAQSSHDDQARQRGRAYLYFWPGGQTERAAIQLTTARRKADDLSLVDVENATTITLVVAPLTGKVTVVDGAAPLVKADSERDQSDREDPGSF
jgi:general secretion pathway protein H